MAKEKLKELLPSLQSAGTAIAAVGLVSAGLYYCYKNAPTGCVDTIKKKLGLGKNNSDVVQNASNDNSAGNSAGDLPIANKLTVAPQ